MLLYSIESFFSRSPTICENGPVSDTKPIQTAPYIEISNQIFELYFV